jgi:hypothetical protein
MELVHIYLMSADYVTIYAKNSIESLKSVLDDLSSYNGLVHISWRNTSPLYKTSFNYDKCLDLEFPNTDLAKKFILNFNKKLNITKENLSNIEVCAVIDCDEPTIQTIIRQLEYK